MKAFRRHTARISDAASQARQGIPEAMTAEQYQAMAETPSGRRKYRNIPVTLDGLRFDSKAEARRWGELILLLKAGEIVELRHHPEFHLGGDPAIWYVADFSYRTADGALHVEDVKGGNATVTAAFRIKQRLMKSVHGIEVEIVQ